MLIGVPKEIKNNEFRVGIIPSGVSALKRAGHKVLVEESAGEGVGYSDSDYKLAGAEIKKAAEIFAEAELIVKVKEPQKKEYESLRKDQILFTYLHLAPDPDQTQGLIKSGCIAIAYETVTDRFRQLPLLKPMSEVAGRMAVQAGAYALQKVQGGLGVLLPGVPGVPPANVLVLGGGVVGINAARAAIGIGAQVTIMDISLPRLTQIDNDFGPRLITEFSTLENICKHLPEVDLVIGAVLIPGAAAPKLITRAMLSLMRKGSVIVDVAIDQGGCAETSKPTTHQDPIYTVEGILHYCVANMPGGVARTSTLALTNATLPYILQLANLGAEKALQKDPHFAEGLNVYKGAITNKAVADALNLPYQAFH